MFNIFRLFRRKNVIGKMLKDKSYENMTSKEMYDVVSDCLATNDDLYFYDDILKFVTLAVEKDPARTKSLKKKTASEIAEGLLYTDALYREPPFDDDDE